jgi:ribosomal protein L33
MDARHRLSVSSDTVTVEDAGVVQMYVNWPVTLKCSVCEGTQYYTTPSSQSITKVKAKKNTLF